MRWPLNKAWTSARKCEGHYHFEIKRYGGKGSKRWVELYPVLEKELIIKASLTELKDRNKWKSGRQQLSQDESCEGKIDHINCV